MRRCASLFAATVAAAALSVPLITAPAEARVVNPGKENVAPTTTVVTSVVSVTAKIKKD